MAGSYAIRGVRERKSPTRVGTRKTRRRKGNGCVQFGGKTFLQGGDRFLQACGREKHPPAVGAGETVTQGGGAQAVDLNVAVGADRPDGLPDVETAGRCAGG